MKWLDMVVKKLSQFCSWNAEFGSIQKCFKPPWLKEWDQYSQANVRMDQFWKIHPYRKNRKVTYTKRDNHNCNWNRNDVNSYKWKNQVCSTANNDIVEMVQTRIIITRLNYKNVEDKVQVLEDQLILPISCWWWGGYCKTSQNNYIWLTVYMYTSLFHI